MFAVDALPPPPPAGQVVVSIPDVATSATDGLPRELHPGRRRVVVPVFVNAAAAARIGRLEVGGRECASAMLPAGAPLTLRCTLIARAGQQVTVRLVAGGETVRVWRHTVRG